MEKAIRESSIRTRLGKSSTLRMLIRKPRKRTILVCVCGRYQNGMQNRKHETDLEISDEKTLSWKNRHHSSTMCISVALKENAK